jgi:hypothetical protein
VNWPRFRARHDQIRDLTILRVRAGALTIKCVEEIDGWMAARAASTQLGAELAPVQNHENSKDQRN